MDLPGLLLFRVPSPNYALTLGGQMSLGGGRLPSVPVFTNKLGFRASLHPDREGISIRP